jgi:hypothetical protein
MQKLSLDALARELLGRAAGASGGRAAQTVIGGHEKVLRQTVIAMVKDAALTEHANPAKPACVCYAAGSCSQPAASHGKAGTAT